MKQNEFNLILDALNNYFPITKIYIEAKNSLQKIQKPFPKTEKKLSKALQKEYFS